MSAELLSEIRAMRAEYKTTMSELKRPVVTEAGRVISGDAPFARKGQDVMSSRPFRFINMLGLACGKLDPEEAKVEFHAMESFRKGMDDTRANYAAFGAKSWAYPLSFSYLNDDINGHESARSLKSLMNAGRGASDPDEILWLANRIARYQNSPDVVKAALTGAQSYLDDSLMGSTVAPPVQGELIPLMRNMSAMDRLGCTQFALPPNGKAVFPRQTSASTAYWITENTTITTSQIQTGQMALQAKKLGIAFVVPNDLFKFASASADALIQADGAKSLALKMDQAALYGAGGGEPKGLTLYTGSNEIVAYEGLSPTPAGLGADGNTVRPEDAEYMIGQIEDRNFDVDQGFGWLMRGSMWRRLNASRASAVTAGDEEGPFATSITRLLADEIGSNWSGYKVVRSAQVQATETKGSTSTGLSSIFGGMWNEMVMAMYGAVEFARSPGENAFLADQTIIRGILYGDIGLRYPGAFCRYKQVKPRFS